jgi:Nitrogen regulatory protein P-II
MQTTLKKRLEIVIEAPVLDRLTRVFDNRASGFTVIPALTGRGTHGVWSRAGEIGDAGRMVILFAIIDPDELDETLEAVYKVVSRQIGIVSVSDVQVVRDDHFKGAAKPAP